MTDGFKFTPIHRELIKAVERVQQATDALHELWSESGSDASDLMHDSAVNYWYPFNDELGQVVFKMEAWRAVLAREKDCCPCDGCGEVVMSDEVHGANGELLCGDCYDAVDSCEDAGCSDHGVDAMHERWAEIAHLANLQGYKGSPKLTAKSTLKDLTLWLGFNGHQVLDPEDRKIEGFAPLTLEVAWEEVNEARWAPFGL